jgi:hypothetical protein
LVEYSVSCIVAPSTLSSCIPSASVLVAMSSTHHAAQEPRSSPKENHLRRPSETEARALDGEIDNHHEPDGGASEGRHEHTVERDAAVGAGRYSLTRQDVNGRPGGQDAELRG